MRRRGRGSALQPRSGNRGPPGWTGRRNPVGLATHRLICADRKSPARPKSLPGCPSWARTRTLLIQRNRCNRLNSGNLPPFTRVRATRCQSLPTWMPDFAGPYSLTCRSLPESRPRDPFRAARLASRSPPNHVWALSLWRPTCPISKPDFSTPWPIATGSTRAWRSRDGYGVSRARPQA